MVVEHHSRRAFLAALAALAAPLFARLALPAPKERKLLAPGESFLWVFAGDIWISVGEVRDVGAWMFVVLQPRRTTVALPGLPADCYAPGE
jgi:hypothetical protein